MLLSNLAPGAPSAPIGYISPAHHSAFRNVDELLDFVEELGQETGLPISIKSAVGESAFWRDFAHRIATEERAIDFISIDGGERGTGAAPLVFSDHVALPFKQGLSRVYRREAMIVVGCIQGAVRGVRRRARMGAPARPRLDGDPRDHGRPRARAARALNRRPLSRLNPGGPPRSPGSRPRTAVVLLARRHEPRRR